MGPDTNKSGLIVITVGVCKELWAKPLRGKEGRVLAEFGYRFGNYSPPPPPPVFFSVFFFLGGGGGP